MDIRFQARGFEEEGADAVGSTPLVPNRQELAQVELDAADRKEVAEIVAAVADPELRARFERVVLQERRSRRWKEQQGWRRCRKCGLPHPEASEWCGYCRPRRMDG